MDKTMQKLLAMGGGIISDMKIYTPVQLSMLTPVDKLGMDGVRMSIPQAIYNKGDIIDIRPSANGLPNRICIQSVLLDVSSNGAGWVYECEFESDHSVLAINEAFITEKMINTSFPVYKLDIIKERYSKGWRYYGKYPINHAKELGQNIAQSPLVKHVRICEAYDPQGKMVSDKVSLWIMYQTPINGDLPDGIDIKLK